MQTEKLKKLVSGFQEYQTLRQYSLFTKTTQCDLTKDPAYPKAHQTQAMKTNDTACTLTHVSKEASWLMVTTTSAGPSHRLQAATTEVPTMSTSGFKEASPLTTTRASMSRWWIIMLLTTHLHFMLKIVEKHTWKLKRRLIDQLLDLLFILQTIFSFHQFQFLWCLNSRISIKMHFRPKVSNHLNLPISISEPTLLLKTGQTLNFH